MINLWKSSVDGPHGPLCPGALGLLIHAVPEHDLHETMDPQHVSAPIALHHGVSAQHLQCFVELERIGSRSTEDGAQFGSASRQQLFRDGIRSQKRAQAQYLSGSRTLLLNLLKRE